MKYELVWDTEYVSELTQECNVEYKKECLTKQVSKCGVEYEEECLHGKKQECYADHKKECHTAYKPSYQAYTETECKEHYKEECEFHWQGSGSDKVWVKDIATCKQVPVKNCHDVSKSKLIKVPETDCTNVPHQTCTYTISLFCLQQTRSGSY